MREFSVQTTGKWILAGEHAVLRGSPALVFPLESRVLRLSYRERQAGESESLELEWGDENGEELQLLFWGVLEKACEIKKLRRSAFSGRIRLESRIPVGAGLGASAAFCVAMARWFSHLGIVPEAEVSEFARRLENLFHGESSGVDIAVAMQGRPLRFIRGEAPREFPVSWRPKLFVSYSGQRGVTVDCVNQVKRLFETHPERAELLDQKMRKAVAECEEALGLPESRGLPLLAEAMGDASQCFVEWGLVEGTPLAHMSRLKELGALATKPTGSGKGGFVLSLWRNDPPAELRGKLISCFSGY